RTACPIKPPAGTCGATTAFLFPSPPFRTGWRSGGKKASRQMWTSYLDWGLADFSGYIAADELYDGPFCVLSIVDNRTFKRLLYQVLDHDPDHQDIKAFLHRFRMALRLRSLTLCGVTTDASPLYPEPLREVFGDVPHQICEFHIIKELTKAILRAVAKVRLLHLLARERRRHAPTPRPEAFALVLVEASREPDREADGQAGRGVEVQFADGTCLPAPGGLPALLGIPLALLGGVLPDRMVCAGHAFADRAHEEGGPDVAEAWRADPE